MNAWDQYENKYKTINIKYKIHKNNIVLMHSQNYICPLTQKIKMLFTVFFLYRLRVKNVVTWTTMCLCLSFSQLNQSCHLLPGKQRVKWADVVWFSFPWEMKITKLTWTQKHRHTHTPRHTPLYFTAWDSLRRHISLGAIKIRLLKLQHMLMTSL